MTPAQQRLLWRSNTEDPAQTAAIMRRCVSSEAEDGVVVEVTPPSVEAAGEDTATPATPPPGAEARQSGGGRLRRSVNVLSTTTSEDADEEDLGTTQGEDEPSKQRHRYRRVLGLCNLLLRQQVPRRQSIEILSAAEHFLKGRPVRISDATDLLVRSAICSLKTVAAPAVPATVALLSEGTLGDKIDGDSHLVAAPVMAARTKSTNEVSCGLNAISELNNVDCPAGKTRTVKAPRKDKALCKEDRIKDYDSDETSEACGSKDPQNKEQLRSISSNKNNAVGSAGDTDNNQVGSAGISDRGDFSRATSAKSPIQPCLANTEHLKGTNADSKTTFQSDDQTKSVFDIPVINNDRLNTGEHEKSSSADVNVSTSYNHESFHPTECPHTDTTDRVSQSSKRGPAEDQTKNTDLPVPQHDRTRSNDLSKHSESSSASNGCATLTVSQERDSADANVHHANSRPMWQIADFEEKSKAEVPTKEPEVQQIKCHSVTSFGSVRERIAAFESRSNSSVESCETPSRKIQICVHYINPEEHPVGEEEVKNFFDMDRTGSPCTFVRAEDEEDVHADVEVVLTEHEDEEPNDGKKCEDIEFLDIDVSGSDYQKLYATPELNPDSADIINFQDAASEVSKNSGWTENVLLQDNHQMVSFPNDSGTEGQKSNTVPPVDPETVSQPKGQTPSACSEAASLKDTPNFCDVTSDSGPVTHDDMVKVVNGDENISLEEQADHGKLIDEIFGIFSEDSDSLPSLPTATDVAVDSGSGTMADSTASTYVTKEIVDLVGETRPFVQGLLNQQLNDGTYRELLHESNTIHKSDSCDEANISSTAGTCNLLGSSVSTNGECTVAFKKESGEKSLESDSVTLKEESHLHHHKVNENTDLPSPNSARRARSPSPRKRSPRKCAAIQKSVSEEIDITDLVGQNVEEIYEAAVVSVNTVEASADDLFDELYESLKAEEAKETQPGSETNEIPKDVGNEVNTNYSNFGDEGNSSTVEKDPFPSTSIQMQSANIISENSAQAVTTDIVLTSHLTDPVKESNCSSSGNKCDTLFQDPSPPASEEKPTVENVVEASEKIIILAPNEEPVLSKTVDLVDQSMLQVTIAVEAAVDLSKEVDVEVDKLSATVSQCDVEELVSETEIEAERRDASDAGQGIALDEFLQVETIADVSSGITTANVDGDLPPPGFKTGDSGLKPDGAAGECEGELTDQNDGRYLGAHVITCHPEMKVEPDQRNNEILENDGADILASNNNESSKTCYLETHFPSAGTASQDISPSVTSTTAICATRDDNIAPDTSFDVQSDMYGQKVEKRSTDTNAEDYNNSIQIWADVIMDLKAGDQSANNSSILEDIAEENVVHRLSMQSNNVDVIQYDATTLEKQFKPYDASTDFGNSAVDTPAVKLEVTPPGDESDEEIILDIGKHERDLQDERLLLDTENSPTVQAEMVSCSVKESIDTVPVFHEANDLLINIQFDNNNDTYTSSSVIETSVEFVRTAVEETNLEEQLSLSNNQSLIDIGQGEEATRQEKKDDAENICVTGAASHESLHSFIHTTLTGPINQGLMDTDVPQQAEQTEAGDTTNDLILLEQKNCVNKIGNEDRDQRLGKPSLQKTERLEGFHHTRVNVTNVAHGDQDTALIDTAIPQEGKKIEGADIANLILLEQENYTNKIGNEGGDQRLGKLALQTSERFEGFQNTGVKVTVVDHGVEGLVANNTPQNDNSALNGEQQTDSEDIIPLAVEEVNIPVARICEVLEMEQPNCEISDTVLPGKEKEMVTEDPFCRPDGATEQLEGKTNENSMTGTKRLDLRDSREFTFFVEDKTESAEDTPSSDVQVDGFKEFATCLNGSDKNKIEPNERYILSNSASDIMIQACSFVKTSSQDEETVKRRSIEENHFGNEVALLDIEASSEANNKAETVTVVVPLLRSENQERKLVEEEMSKENGTKTPTSDIELSEYVVVREETASQTGSTVPHADSDLTDYVVVHEEIDNDESALQKEFLVETPLDNKESVVSAAEMPSVTTLFVSTADFKAETVDSQLKISDLDEPENISPHDLQEIGTTREARLPNEQPETNEEQTADTETKTVADVNDATRCRMASDAEITEHDGRTNPASENQEKTESKNTLDTTVVGLLSSALEDDRDTEFHLWPSDVPLGPPPLGTTTAATAFDDSMVDFESVISAPNLEEALRQLEDGLQRALVQNQQASSSADEEANESTPEGRYHYGDELQAGESVDSDYVSMDDLHNSCRRSPDVRSRNCSNEGNGSSPDNSRASPPRSRFPSDLPGGRCKPVYQKLTDDKKGGGRMGPAEREIWGYQDDSDDESDWLDNICFTTYPRVLSPGPPAMVPIAEEGEDDGKKSSGGGEKRQDQQTATNDRLAASTTDSPNQMFLGSDMSEVNSCAGAADSKHPYTTGNKSPDSFEESDNKSSGNASLADNERSVTPSDHSEESSRQSSHGNGSRGANPADPRVAESPNGATPKRKLSVPIIVIEDADMIENLYTSFPPQIDNELFSAPERPTVVAVSEKRQRKFIYYDDTDVHEITTVTCEEGPHGKSRSNDGTAHEIRALPSEINVQSTSADVSSSMLSERSGQISAISESTSSDDQLPCVAKDTSTFKHGAHVHHEVENASVPMCPSEATEDDVMRPSANKTDLGAAENSSDNKRTNDRDSEKANSSPDIIEYSELPSGNILVPTVPEKRETEDFTIKVENLSCEQSEEFKDETVRDEAESSSNGEDNKEVVIIHEETSSVNSVSETLEVISTDVLDSEICDKSASVLNEAENVQYEEGTNTQVDIRPDDVASADDYSEITKEPESCDSADTFMIYVTSATPTLSAEESQSTNDDGENLETIRVVWRTEHEASTVVVGSDESNTVISKNEESISMEPAVGSSVGSFERRLQTATEDSNKSEISHEEDSVVMTAVPIRNSSPSQPAKKRVSHWKQWWDLRVNYQKKRDRDGGARVSKRRSPSIRIPGIVNKWRQSFESCGTAATTPKDPSGSAKSDAKNTSSNRTSRVRQWRNYWDSLALAEATAAVTSEKAPSRSQSRLVSSAVAMYDSPRRQSATPDLVSCRRGTSPTPPPSYQELLASGKLDPPPPVWLPSSLGRILGSPASSTSPTPPPLSPPEDHRITEAYSILSTTPPVALVTFGSSESPSPSSTSSDIMTARATSPFGSLPPKRISRPTAFKTIRGAPSSIPTNGTRSQVGEITRRDIIPSNVGSPETYATPISKELLLTSQECNRINDFCTPEPANTVQSTTARRSVNAVDSAATKIISSMMFQDFSAPRTTSPPGIEVLSSIPSTRRVSSVVSKFNSSTNQMPFPHDSTRKSGPYASSGPAAMQISSSGEVSINSLKPLKTARADFISNQLERDSTTSPKNPPSVTDTFPKVENSSAKNLELIRSSKIVCPDSNQTGGVVAQHQQNDKKSGTRNVDGSFASRCDGTLNDVRAVSPDTPTIISKPTVNVLLLPNELPLETRRTDDSTETCNIENGPGKNGGTSGIKDRPRKSSVADVPLVCGKTTDIIDRYTSAIKATEEPTYKREVWVPPTIQRTVASKYISAIGAKESFTSSRASSVPPIKTKRLNENCEVLSRDECISDKAMQTADEIKKTSCVPGQTSEVDKKVKSVDRKLGMSHQDMPDKTLETSANNCEEVAIKPDEMVAAKEKLLGKNKEVLVGSHEMVLYNCEIGNNSAPIPPRTVYNPVYGHRNKITDSDRQHEPSRFKAVERVSGIKKADSESEGMKASVEGQITLDKREPCRFSAIERVSDIKKADAESEGRKASVEGQNNLDKHRFVATDSHISRDTREETGRKTAHVEVASVATEREELSSKERRSREKVSLLEFLELDAQQVAEEELASVRKLSGLFDEKKAASTQPTIIEPSAIPVGRKATDAPSEAHAMKDLQQPSEHKEDCVLPTARHVGSRVTTATMEPERVKRAPQGPAILETHSAPSLPPVIITGEGEEDVETKNRFERARMFFQTLEQTVGRKQDSLESLSYKTWNSSTESEEQYQAARPKGQRRRRPGGCSSYAQSAPCSDAESLSARGGGPRWQSRLAERPGGSERLPRKVSERFHVKDLFRDVLGDGHARGIPHQQAVLAALRSVECDGLSRPVSPYEELMAGGESPEPEPDVLLPRTSPVPQEYHREFPYLPNTPAQRFRPRAALLQPTLIPRSELLNTTD